MRRHCKSLSLRLGAAAVALAAAGSVRAADLRYFAYEADNAAARHRSADIILTVKPGLLSSRVLKIWRKRGKDLALGRPDANPPIKALAQALSVSDDVARDIHLYAVDARDGEGFAQGACDGAADRAFVALGPVKQYQPLVLWVLRLETGKGGPVLCETLTYRWRGEWRLPDQSRRAGDEVGPAASSR